MHIFTMLQFFINNYYIISFYVMLIFSYGKKLYFKTLNNFAHLNNILIDFLIID